MGTFVQARNQRGQCLAAIRTPGDRRACKENGQRGKGAGRLKKLGFLRLGFHPLCSFGALCLGSVAGLGAGDRLALALGSLGLRALALGALSCSGAACFAAGSFAGFGSETFAGFGCFAGLGAGAGFALAWGAFSFGALSCFGAGSLDGFGAL
jgi:hypothetical protein